MYKITSIQHTCKHRFYYGQIKGWAKYCLIGLNDSILFYQVLPSVFTNQRMYELSIAQTIK